MFFTMSGLHIVVASANDALARALANSMRAGGHTVQVEADVRQAAAGIAQSSTDAVLVDLRLPGLERALAVRALLPDDAAVPVPLDVVEREHIARTLRHTGGNKRRAAQLLGIARSTLIQKVRRYQLEAARDAPPDAPPQAAPASPSQSE